MAFKTVASTMRPSSLHHAHKVNACGTCISLRGSRVYLGNRRVLMGREQRRPQAPMGARVVEVVASDETLSPYGERFRLNNLSPQEGSRKNRKRKGRGYGAGQGGSCGYGMRGQKSRSGPGIRPGFEGGQTPLYRRLPKLRGIAGGMPKGRDKFVTINLRDVWSKFNDGDVVSLESLGEKGILNTSGRESRLPLKVLGVGEIRKPVVFKAAQFSKSALKKIEESDASYELVPLKEKWTRKAYEAKVRSGEIVPKSKFWRTRFAFEAAKQARLEKEAGLAAAGTEEAGSSDAGGAEAKS